MSPIQNACIPYFHSLPYLVGPERAPKIPDVFFDDVPGASGFIDDVLAQGRLNGAIRTNVRRNLPLRLLRYPVLTAYEFQMRLGHVDREWAESRASGIDLKGIFGKSSRVQAALTTLRHYPGFGQASAEPEPYTEVMLSVVAQASREFPTGVFHHNQKPDFVSERVDVFVPVLPLVVSSLEAWIVGAALGIAKNIDQKKSLQPPRVSGLGIPDYFAKKLFSSLQYFLYLPNLAPYLLPQGQENLSVLESKMGKPRLRLQRFSEDEIPKNWQQKDIGGFSGFPFVFSGRAVAAYSTYLADHFFGRFKEGDQ